MGIVRHEVELSDAPDLRSLIAAVEQGDDVTVLRDGHAVARLVKAEPPTDRERAERASRRISEIGARLTLGPDLTVRDLIEEGRRY